MNEEYNFNEYLNNIFKKSAYDYDTKKSYIYNDKEILDDYAKKLEFDEFKKFFKYEKLSSANSVEDAIRIFGIRAILKYFIEHESIEKLLELLDIKDIQIFLRNKKLQEIDKSK